jgi:AraC-like DNA-binding protein
MFLCLSVFIILIGFFGLKQQQIFVQDDNQKIEYITENKAKYAGVSIKETDADRYEQELIEYMAKEKPYLDSGLTLSDLSTKLNIPAYQLSRIINEKLGLNFFDFVNQYRVEEVKAKIADPANDNLSLLGIAFESGFNTKSAFNRVFKKMTEQTPSEYKKQLKR